MSQKQSGMNGFGVLGIVFITLKLCDVIAWSWWWVLSPYWIGFLFYLVLFTILALASAR